MAPEPGRWRAAGGRVTLTGGAGATWFKVPIKNIKSESGAERLGLVSMYAGKVSGAVLDLSGPLSSL